MLPLFFRHQKPRRHKKDAHIEVLAIVFLIYSQKYYGVFIDNAAK